MTSRPAQYEFVLDSSALIALVHAEPGASNVRRVVSGSAISAVNWAEVVQHSLEHGRTLEILHGDIHELRVNVVAFDEALAEDTARLRSLTRHLGLSLGDRACLALARRAGAVAVTADRAWTRLDVGVRIEAIR